MRPTSFAEEFMTDWSLWVLDHGLPSMPGDVAIGEAVPVAFWAGPRFGAVVHALRDLDEDEDDGESLDEECVMFRRTASGWEPFDGTGGTNWPRSPRFERIVVPPRVVARFGLSAAADDAGSCCAVHGAAGSGAKWVEVEDAEGVTREPLVAPMGVFVVATDAQREARLRVYDDAGSPLLDTGFSGEF
jgi:hypothetical protein